MSMDQPQMFARRRGFLRLMKTAMVALFLMVVGTGAHAADAKALLQAGFDNWRAKSSESVVKMTIHRTSWERSMTMTNWTRGRDDALVRFTAPAKEAGNATLKVGNKTWVFNPKINQVIKLPASLLSQSWMGSDFSYSDLAKSESILNDYTHKLVGTEKSGGKTVNVIEATPKKRAPVVWGKQVVKVRADGILMMVTYFDQDMKPVREMKTDKVKNFDGRPYPAVMTMRTLANKGEWTRLETVSAKFNVDLPKYLFTQSNLANPRSN